MVQHGGVRAEFCMTVVGVHRTPLVRQVNEAVRIVLSRADCVMNSKNEWHQAPLVRIIPMTGLQEDQGIGRGSLDQQGGGALGRGSRGGGRGVGLRAPGSGRDSRRRGTR